MSGQEGERRILVGVVSKVFGVKGWLRIQSYTQPAENLFKYQPWWIDRNDGCKKEKIAIYQRHGKGFIARFENCDDRDQAQAYVGSNIYVDRDVLPELESGDFYWSDLQGLDVITEQGLHLGQIDRVLETGSNDVLVVQQSAESIDDKERLIPYLPEQVVKKVDLENCTLVVDWDPEY